MGKEKPLSPARRKRGAPPGNTNALKHGFYSKQIWGEEIQPEPGTEIEIEDELNMLRSATQRLFKHMDELNVKTPFDVEVLGRLVSILSSAATRIASMERAQKAAQGEGDQILRALEEIHQRVIEESKLAGKPGKPGKGEGNEESEQALDG